MGENLWLRAKTKANLKLEIKIKVVWNNCDKELGVEMKSAYENCLFQKFTGKLAEVTFSSRNFCNIYRVKR